eukprot:1807667-Rhodomonas_salina.1
MGVDWACSGWTSSRQWQVQWLAQGCWTLVPASGIRGRVYAVLVRNFGKLTRMNVFVHLGTRSRSTGCFAKRG